MMKRNKSGIAGFLQRLWCRRWHRKHYTIPINGTYYCSVCWIGFRSPWR